MEQGLIQFAESRKTMSSLEIARLTGKDHAHVMRDIRNMEPAWEKISQSKFGLASYKDAQGKDRPCYELTKTECLYVATKFNDEARAKLVIRWEELETGKATPAYQLPQSYADALRELAGKVEENERLALENKHQAEVIEEQKPKVVFADAIVGSQSSCLIGELAKIITQNGYKIGQNRLFEWLRNNHFLGTTGEFYNIPNQKYVEQGLFEIKKTSHSENGVMKTTSTPKVTGKGQQYFVNLFLKGDLTLFEREIILPNND